MLYFGGVHVNHLFSFLCCVFGGVHVAHLFSFLCCVFVFVLCLVCVSIDCPFLIALLVFANVYFGVVCIRYVSCTVEELVTILKHLL